MVNHTKGPDAGLTSGGAGTPATKGGPLYSLHSLHPFAQSFLLGLNCL